MNALPGADTGDGALTIPAKNSIEDRILKQRFEAALTSKKDTEAMRLQFAYRDVNSSFQMVPLKVTYKDDKGEQPARINDNEDDDMIRNAWTTVNGAGL